MSLEGLVGIAGKVFAAPIFRVSSLKVYFFSKSFRIGRFSISPTAIWSSDRDLAASPLNSFSEMASLGDGGL